MSSPALPPTPDCRRRSTGTAGRTTSAGASTRGQSHRVPGSAGAARRRAAVTSYATMKPSSAHGAPCPLHATPPPRGNVSMPWRRQSSREEIAHARLRDGFGECGRRRAACPPVQQRLAERDGATECAGQTPIGMPSGPPGPIATGTTGKPSVAATSGRGGLPAPERSHVMPSGAPARCPARTQGDVAGSVPDRAELAHERSRGAAAPARR